MSHHTNLKRRAIGLCAAVSVLFLVFFVYIRCFENVSVYHKNDSHSYTQVTDYTVEYIEDDTAPAGGHVVYRWILQSPQNSENCLCFYISHHYVQVYLGDELVYSLEAAQTNRIGQTISSNWVTLPVHMEDTGKEVRVVLTPLFKSVADKQVDFLLGSHSSIVLSVLEQELPLLLISFLCISLGAFIILVQLYFTLRAHSQVWNLFFLGSFSVILGIWKVTDLKCAPILFPQNPMVLGYISIGSLYLSSIALLLFLTTHFSERNKNRLFGLAIAYGVISFLVLLLQVLGIADLRETLIISHLLLLMTICTLPVAALLKRFGVPPESVNHSWWLFLILAVGILLDMILYYITGSTSNVIFALCSFVVYALVVFMSNTLTATRKAYLDSNTGLSNKSRWTELMNDTTSSIEGIGIVVMDLNGLKRINDTYGHEAGDQVIFQFSNILRNTFPSNSVICRWGGDEFAVLTTGTSQKKLDACIDAITHATQEYNAAVEGAHIHFAAGYALSADYPGLTRNELMSVADSKMYLNKKMWYARNESDN